MKQHWVRLQLRFEASKDVKLEILWRRVALSGNTSLQLPHFLVEDYYVQIAISLQPVENCGPPTVLISTRKSSLFRTHGCSLRSLD